MTKMTKMITAYKRTWKMMNNAYTSIRALPSSAEVKTWEQCI